MKQLHALISGWCADGASAALVSFACAAGSGAAGAAPTFGAYGFEDVSLSLWSGSTLDPSVIGSQRITTPGGAIQQVSSVSLPTLNLTGISGEVGFGLDSMVFGNYSATGSIESGLLHGNVSAEATNTKFCGPPPRNCTISDARADLYLLWMDQITISAPVGVTSVQISYTPFFEGSYAATGGDYVLDLKGQPAAPTAALFDFDFASQAHGEYLHTFEGGGSFRDAVTRTILVTPNVPLSIELQMALYAAAGQQAGPAASFVNAGNTGGLFITVDTPGAVLHSASGFSYDIGPSAEVQEPSSMPLFALGAALLWSRRRRHDGESNGCRQKR